MRERGREGERAALWKEIYDLFSVWGKVRGAWIGDNASTTLTHLVPNFGHAFAFCSHTVLSFRNAWNLSVKNCYIPQQFQNILNKEQKLAIEAIGRVLSNQVIFSLDRLRVYKLLLQISHRWGHYLLKKLNHFHLILSQLPILKMNAIVLSQHHFTFWNPRQLSCNKRHGLKLKLKCIWRSDLLFPL